MIIRAGFKSTCVPAGSAEASVAGEMCIEDAEDAIAMLECTIRSIRRQIDAAGLRQEIAEKERG